MSTLRVAIIGVGQVGGAAANALVLASFASELLLVDIDTPLRDAQVQDLSDVAYVMNSKTRLRAATYREAAQCDLIVITAGSRLYTGQTPLDYVYRNVSIMREVLEAMMPFRAETILLVVANPVDLLTSIAKHISRLPSSQVLGSGTFLDSIRIRGLVADHVGVQPSSLDLYVVGVQGESQVVLWSAGTIGGIPLAAYTPVGSLDPVAMAHECGARSQSIIQTKGAIPLGVGCAVASLCASILLDKRDIRPVSHFQEGSGCCFSLPAMLGKKGVLHTVPLSLEQSEQAELDKSVGVLKSKLDRMRKV